MTNKETLKVEPQTKERFFNAIKNNDIERIKNIVESEVPIVDIQCINEALIIALERYYWEINWEIVKYLIEHGADVNTEYRKNQTALIIASRDGNLEIVKYLIEHGATNINDALINATPNCNLEIVKYLIEHGADINAKDNDGYSVLYYATYANLEIIKYIVDKGADITDINHNYNGKTVLDKVLNSITFRIGNDIERLVYDGYKDELTYGYMEIAEYLIKNGADISDKGQSSSYLNWALCYASRYGNLEVVKYLLDKGANINYTSEYFYSVLYLALVNGNVKLIKYLLENGANIDPESISGQYSLEKAFRNGNLEIIKCLIEELEINRIMDDDFRLDDNFWYIYLPYACESGNLELIKYLESKCNCYINKYNINNLILNACKSGNLELVKYLFDYYYIDDFLLYTTCAYSNNNLELVKYLVEEHRLNCNTKFPFELGKENENFKKYGGAFYRKNSTALDEAVRCGNLEVVKYLVYKGADINAIKLEDAFSFFNRELSVNLELVKYLIENGADINAKDDEGRTPLMHACCFPLRSKSGEMLNPDIVKSLIKAGVNINEVDKNGNSALLYASTGGYRFFEETIKLLINNGANVNIRNKKGETPLSLSKENPKLTKLLIDSGAYLQ